MLEYRSSKKSDGETWGRRWGGRKFWVLPLLLAKAGAPFRGLFLGGGGLAQRQHLGSCQSIQTEKGKNESDREEGWGIRLRILWGGGGQGMRSLIWIFLGLVLSWKEDTGEPLTCSGGSYWGALSSGASGTRQGWPWPECLSCFHSTCLFAEGPYEKGEVRRWGRDPKSPFLSSLGHQKRHGLGAGWKRISRHETEWEGNKVY